MSRHHVVIVGSGFGGLFAAKALARADVDVTIIAPQRLLDDMQTILTQRLQGFFPAAAVRLRAAEDSGHDSRVYVLLVASTTGGLRWGRDVLASCPRAKGRRHATAAAVPTTAEIAASVCGGVCRELRDEVAAGGDVDAHLQDQLVCFQALADGCSVVTGSGGGEDGPGALKDMLRAVQLGQGRHAPDRTRAPFGAGSMHTKTARWVAAELLPAVRFFRQGVVCEGAGYRCEGA